MRPADGTSSPLFRLPNLEPGQGAATHPRAPAAPAPPAPPAATAPPAAKPQPKAELPEPAPPPATSERPASGVYPPYPGHADDAEPVHHALEGLAHLDYYYGQLALTDLKVPGAITRASHWGDSVMGGDGITHVIREKLQARFGDAGHGYHIIDKYHIGYHHKGVWFRDRGGWKSCHIIYKCRKQDMRYGYGGVTTTSHGGGRSVWRTTEEGVGQAVSRFELWYAKEPGGGRFEIRVDGAVARTVDTESSERADAVETVSVADGPHELEVRAIGGGPARGYGVVLERDVPGVVWDELSQIGAFTQRLDYQDPSHIAGQVARRDVDLMVFILGGNDVQRGATDLKSDMSRYEAEYTRVLTKFRAGKPRASCLVMTPIDHGYRQGGAIRSRPIMFRLVASQRKVAAEQGCAFFDTFTAMGGEGAIGRWFRARPQLAAKDLVHPSQRGQRQLATWLYHALMQGYAQFRQARVGQPLPALDRARPLPAEPAVAALGG